MNTPDTDEINAALHKAAGHRNAMRDRAFGFATHVLDEEDAIANEHRAGSSRD